MLILVLYPNLLNVSSCNKSIFTDILYSKLKKYTKKRLNFSKFGITKFNLVVFTISQWDLVLQLSKYIYLGEDHDSGYIQIPRGCYDALISYNKNAEIQMMIDDKRQQGRSQCH